MAYEHIRFTRDEPVRARHRRPGFPRNLTPSDPKGFGKRLGVSLAQAKEKILRDSLGGFDKRLLLKIRLREGAPLPGLESIGGITIVSQEDRDVVLAFASEVGLATFESRLVTLSDSGNVTRSDIFFSIQDFDEWTPENRLGKALKEQGFPSKATFMLDAELWPLDNKQQQLQSLAAFETWCQDQQIEILDRLNLPSLVMIRVLVTETQANQLQSHRDVRTLDLPPNVGLSLNLITEDVNQYTVEALPTDPPDLGLLDSGVTVGHPLLTPAIGEAQGFVRPLLEASDNPVNGHGTFVAGIATFGDLKTHIEDRSFVPQLRLFSGKVFHDDGSDQTEFVEKSVEAAVLYFKNTYDCKVFNLSYGDWNKVYDGRHVRGLAYTLDRMTRELGVLFVVPTGNLTRNQIPSAPHTAYPGYLLEESSRLLDPAPALNVITVGGLAEFEQSLESQRHENKLEDVPIAKSFQPSPFTRSGFSVGNAIKPDFVEVAGNWAVSRTGMLRDKGLGVVSLNSGFASGYALREDRGTSFAAPRLAHLAARLAKRFNANSINLIRAILACNASWPDATVNLLNENDDSLGKERLLKLTGYGRVNPDSLFESDDQIVTLYAEDSIAHDRNHFFELPLPDEFWAEGNRVRELTVALAHSPDVKTTRLDYKQTKLSFSLVEGSSLSLVADAFTHNREDGMPERSTGRSITSNLRKPGTLQTSTWTFTRPIPRRLFVVVTRQDANWSSNNDSLEPYALSVVVRDRENETANLYQRITAIVQARSQERARARVRV